MTCPVCGSLGHVAHGVIPHASFILDTPSQINAWRLLAFYHMLKLELKGMHHSSGQRASVWVRAILVKAERPAPRSRTGLLAEYEKYLVENGFLKRDIPQPPS